MKYYRRSMIKFLIILLILLLGSSCAAKDPQEPETVDLVGLSGKRDPEAEIAFSKARILWRSSGSAGLQALETCSDPAQAIQLLNQAIELEPQYAEAYLWRGLARSELGELEPAFEDATAAIRLHPQPEWYAYRGLISLRAGNFSGARKDLEYSLERKSSQHLAWKFKGMLSLAEGDTRQACDDFSRACSRGDCGYLEIAREENICR